MPNLREGAVWVQEEQVACDDGKSNEWCVCALSRAAGQVCFHDVFSLGIGYGRLCGDGAAVDREDVLLLLACFGTPYQTEIAYGLQTQIETNERRKHRSAQRPVKSKSSAMSTYESVKVSHGLISPFGLVVYAAEPNGLGLDLEWRLTHSRCMAACRPSRP